MKRIVIFTALLTLSIVACGRKSDAEKLLDTLEKRLIEKGVLESGESAAYYRFFERVAEDGFPETVIDVSDLDMSPLDLSAMPLDSAKYMGLQKRFDAAIERGDFSAETIAAAIVSELSPADFETFALKARTIVMIVMADQNSGGMVSDTAPVPDALKEMRVSIDDGDNIHVDERPVSENEALALVEDFVRANKADHMIRLSNSKGTSFGAYVDLQNKLTGVYDTLRAEEAVAKFGKQLDDLAPEQRAEIEALYPVRIAE